MCWTSTVICQSLGEKNASVAADFAVPGTTVGRGTRFLSKSAPACPDTKLIRSVTELVGLDCQNFTASLLYSSTSSTCRNSSKGSRISTARLSARSAGVELAGIRKSVAGAAPMTLALRAVCGNTAATALARAARRLVLFASSPTQSAKPSSAYDCDPRSRIPIQLRRSSSAVDVLTTAEPGRKSATTTEFGAAL